ncbi:elongation factor P maturation arginine rhamnosyltransferase EarP [Parasulfuritortus cantonensis]|uniref:Protein-arginine rhamnosyltransferase n=2 Tax=Parasulfuritortus cantonensis TaxID=2528202 RepID=A0A4R1BIA5_9PROT|nr:elongation factor P maturation arginine rhamnosyltransferase EarP [Parasulfuritortus cantonensis]TCJ16999.1 elongation factor P maturation arginine rhamnosyltransferase EarP [Parasulfuritortus cantonensis]
MRPGYDWDLFCAVVDNYGDIGITWRLARQLASEHRLRVRLWVDDLAAFRCLRPEIDPDLDEQACQGVTVRHWRAPFPAAEPADVVVEALACHLPESYESAMAERPVKPVWLNLEYLSAEDWVPGCHALASPHPRLPLTKYFFLPGYVPGTGGVLKESWLVAARDDLRADPAAQAAFWRRLAVPEAEESRISLFSYENTAIQGLFETWADGPERVRCLVPEGRPLADVAGFFGRPAVAAGEQLVRGNLAVQVLPMLSQDDYDRLLWLCDCNFVRGEDSLVRAMWAGKPLVWQAYRQEDQAHWPKIHALLDLLCGDLDPGDADALRALWSAWNDMAGAGPAWPEFWHRRPAWLARLDRWQAQLDGVGDLATNLVKFCNEKSK